MFTSMRMSIQAEAFKRLKRRLSLEHVSGLSQQAVVQDVSAKIMTDNLQALTAHSKADLAAVDRINHASRDSPLESLLVKLFEGAHHVHHQLFCKKAALGTSNNLVALTRRAIFQ